MRRQAGRQADRNGADTEKASYCGGIGGGVSDHLFARLLLHLHQKVDSKEKGKEMGSTKSSSSSSIIESPIFPTVNMRVFKSLFHSSSSSFSRGEEEQDFIFFYSSTKQSTSSSSSSSCSWSGEKKRNAEAGVAPVVGSVTGHHYFTLQHRVVFLSFFLAHLRKKEK